ncbi:MAG: hypothetical protein KGI08_09255 [Thaumarchaeota archaeon]|nr:hypothetical protein [Nitrososphaerota archaeon]
MANDGWQKVGMSSIWDYKALKKGAEVVGVYLYKEEGIGENNSTLYTLELPDGSGISIWGNTLLDMRFKNLKEGEEVKVVYLGQEPSQKRKGKFYHNFEVYHRVVPFAQVSSDVNEVAPDDIPDNL